MAIERFEDIEAWQAARELTRQIYKATLQGLFTRDYGLRDQVQRAAVSVMANIAEGFDSQSNRAFIQFLGYALRSATEVQSHLYVAVDQKYIDQEEFDRAYQQAVKVKNILYGFMRYLRSATHESGTSNMKLETLNVELRT
jgi:four helix bundle protein